jgi:hypothetical protein
MGKRTETICCYPARYPGADSAITLTVRLGVRRSGIFHGESYAESIVIVAVVSGLSRLRHAPNPRRVLKANNVPQDQMASRARLVPRAPRVNKGFRDRKGRAQRSHRSVSALACERRRRASQRASRPPGRRCLRELRSSPPPAVCTGEDVFTPPPASRRFRENRRPGGARARHSGRYGR